MTPSQLVELAEAKDFIKAGDFRKARNILILLQQNDPQDQEINKLIQLCNTELGIKPQLQPINYQTQPPPPQVIIQQPTRPQEVFIRFKDPFLISLILFLIIVCALITSWYIIFDVLKFTLKVSTNTY
jgi:hypothetical protein